MAFLDKLKDNGVGLIQWIWTNLKSIVENMIVSTFKSLFDKLKDIVLWPLHEIQNAITSFYQHLSDYTPFLPAPIRVLIMISIAGAAVAGIIWLVKRVYELL